MSRVRRRVSLPPSECVYLRALSGALLRSRVRELYALGWSLGDIAHAWDPPKHRSTIKTWVDAPHTPSLLSSSSSSSSSSHSSFIGTPEKNEFPSTPAPSSAPSETAPALITPSEAARLALTSSSSSSSALLIRTAERSNRRERRVFTHRTLDTATRAKISDLAPLARRYRARANPYGAYAVANEELTVICKDLFESGTTVRELAEAAGVTYRAMARRLGVSK